MEIALQTFTIRHAMRKDLTQALQAAKAAGYAALELSRVRPTPENADIIKKLGLKVVSVQKSYRYLSAHFEETVRFLQAVGCDTVEVSVMDWKAIVFGRQALLRFCEQVNSLANRFDQQGIRTCYHHHDFEFAVSGGEQKLDTLLENLDKHIGFVSDTYWSKKAGYDPVAVFDRIGSRLVAVHLRDHKKLGRKHMDCELGRGDIDFLRVFQEAGDVQYFAVEQNTRTPMDSIAQSLAWLQKEGYC